MVGSGPAGLAAAVELVKEGYNVTVYERDEKLGGYLSYGIPSDRLSQELVDHEINQVKELGVEFKNNTSVENPKDLLSEGFDAVIWACGLHKGKTLNIDGMNLENVEIGVDYLRKVKEDPQNLYAGKNVIVIGGGDVAMDVARTAKLRGAENVNILYRRTENEMPAYIDEKVETKEAGVNIYVKFKPVSIEGNSKVEKATFESLGNDTTITMKCDQYILAISQESERNIDDLVDTSKGIFAAGASGISAINTIKSITGIDFDKMVGLPIVNGKSSISGYSGKAVKPIALRFIQQMRMEDKLKNVPISGIGGIETWKDALEFILLGASNLQVTTAVMQYGYRIVEDMISGLSYFMEERGIDKLEDLVGIANNNIIPAEDIDRTFVIYPEIDKDKCIGCGRCYVSCFDGGHQAYTYNEETREVTLNKDKCVGCHLCSLVCPVGAISKGEIMFRDGKVKEIVM